jgi:hypothetical protein
MIPLTSVTLAVAWRSAPARGFNRAIPAMGSVGIAGGCLVFGLLCATSADANIILNAGFETGTFTPWTITGNVALTAVPSFGEGSAGVDGAQFAVFNAGNTAPNGVLSQTFATVAGAQYTMTYLYGSNGGQRQSITTSVRDAQGAVLETQFVTLPAVSGNLAPFGLVFSADTASSTLAFSDFSGNPTAGTDGFVDDVSVTLAPEPSSLALLATGVLGCIGAGSLRRRGSS